MAAMAASPRKNAPAFNQTWDETDAAFLDPTSLPIQRVPRAWDRKHEVKHVGNGKKKEIWRRYGTRSRTSAASSNEEPEEAGARPVKRQQRLSPQAIEKSAMLRSGKTRAYKATRWDRRKSVLPRKKVAGFNPAGESSILTEEEEEESTITESGNDSFSEVIVYRVESNPQEAALFPEGEDQRAAFTFAMDEDEVMPTENQSTPAVGTAPANVESAEYDATITRLFRSPTKSIIEDAIPNELNYPDLSVGPESEAEAAPVSNQDSASEVGVESTVDELSTSAHLEDTVTDEAAAGQAEFSIQETEEEAVDPADGFADVEQEAVLSPQKVQDEPDDFDSEGQDDSPDENFTEASLQLDIQRDMRVEEPTISAHDNIASESNAVEDLEQSTEQEQPAEMPSSAIEDGMDDITSGLTLGPMTPSSREPTPRKLRSPSPPPRTESGPEDATMTFAFDDDTALLKDFLSRAAASKANKAENIARRESLQNRRDSDVVRHALSSPRKVLEDKDPNSPSKYDNETLDLSQTLTLSMEPPAPLSPTKSPSKARVEPEAEDVDDAKAKGTSRRSSRARKSRLPAPSSIPTGPPKIAVKRDGSEPVVLKKTDAQELSLLTRANTRKNKQGYAPVNMRLLKLSSEPRSADNTTQSSDATDSVAQVPGKKYVRWDTQLAYFQTDAEALANALAEAESLAIPDELSTAVPTTRPTKVKVPKIDKNAVVKNKINKEKDADKSATATSTPKVRKVKNLGSANGTPGKGLLGSDNLLPDNMRADADETARERTRVPKPKSKTARVKKAAPLATDTASAAAPAPTLESKLPVLEIAPVGVGIDPTKPAPAPAAKERKSRLATPRKVKIPQLSASAGGVGGSGNGKENERKGISSPPKKAVLPVPAVVVPPPSLEASSGATGLPRRRARRV